MDPDAYLRQTNSIESMLPPLPTLPSMVRHGSHSRDKMEPPEATLKMRMDPKTIMHPIHSLIKAIEETKNSDEPKRHKIDPEPVQMRLIRSPVLSLDSSSSDPNCMSVSPPGTVSSSAYGDRSESDSGSTPSVSSIGKALGSRSEASTYLFPATDEAPQVLLTISSSFKPSAFKPFKTLYPNMQNDLFYTLAEIQSHDPKKTSSALQVLFRLLEHENLGDQTTTALYRACGHSEVVKACKKHPNSCSVQVQAMRVLDKLLNSKRIKKIDFGEIDGLKQSVISVGMVEQARVSMQTFPNEVILAGWALGAVNRCLGMHTFDQLFDLGLMRMAVDKMNMFPADPSVQRLGTDFLRRAAKCKEANRSRFEKLYAISILGKTLEQFQDEQEDAPVKVYHQADEVLCLILSLQREECSGLVLAL